MKISSCIFLAVGLRAASISHAVVIEMSFVGDAFNDNDSTGFGSVGYDYHIGTYAVTNAQYTVFLNAVARTGDPHGLYNVNMFTQTHGGISQTGDGTDGNPFIYSVRTANLGFNSGASMGEMPVNYVSFWDAARFTNWLTNGQPTGGQGAGTTETGVYNLGGVTNPTNETITRDVLAWANGGVAIASENEWYKAAYYNPTSLTYSLYPTGSDTAPTATVPTNTNANSANYFGSGVDTVTPVGAYTMAASAYGTFDQAGNVWEWNDEILFTGSRGLRGGSFGTNADALQSSGRNSGNPSTEFSGYGFRVSSLEPIPEPSTYAAIFGLLTLGFVLWRRKGRGTL